METLERLLKDDPFLQGLAEEQIRFVVGCAKNLRFPEGTLIFREGGEADALYVMRSGRVALESQVPGRGTVELETLEPGDVLGVSWLFPPFRWSLDARAVETVTAFSFDAACLRGKMTADPAFGYELSRRMLSQLAARLTRVRLQRLDLYRAEP